MPKKTHQQPSPTLTKVFPIFCALIQTNILNKYIYTDEFNFTLFFFLDSLIPTVISVSQHHRLHCLSMVCYLKCWRSILNAVLKASSRSVAQLRHHTRVSQSHTIPFNLVQKLAPQQCAGGSHLFCVSQHSLSVNCSGYRRLYLSKIFFSTNIQSDLTAISTG